MTGSRRDFLLGVGGAAATVAALAGPAVAGRVSQSAALPLGSSSGAGRVPLLVSRIADGHGADRAGLARLKPGEPVALALAPTDYDPRAVAVSAGGQRVGYVPRLRAEALANLLAAGYTAEGVVRETRGGGLRPEVMVDVHLIA